VPEDFRAVLLGINDDVEHAEESVVREKSSRSGPSGVQIAYALDGKDKADLASISRPRKIAAPTPSATAANDKAYGDTRQKAFIGRGKTLRLLSAMRHVGAPQRPDRRLQYL